MHPETESPDSAIECEGLRIPDLFVFKSPRREDRRGYVQATYNSTVMKDIPPKLCQENHC